MRGAVAGEEAGARTQAVPRVGMPEAGAGVSARQPAGKPKGGNSPRELLERLRENPAPLVLAVVALAVLTGVLVFVFGGGGDEPQTAERAPSGGRRKRRAASLLRPLRRRPGERLGRRLRAFAGFGRHGDAHRCGPRVERIGDREGGRPGQTLTLDGPTAAQLERGFDIGDWDVEPGVYAVAQRDSGEVLHVTTQTLVPQDEARAAEEMTLGTVYAFGRNRFAGFAYYLDTREPGSERITRTYFGPSIVPYRVSYRAPDPEAREGDRNGAFVPLLVGWRGFQNDQTTGGGK